MITVEKVNELILKPKSAGEISRALASQREHKLHVSGKGFYDWWLKRAEKLESENSFELKKMLAKPTTPRISSAVKKQFFKIFRAQGFVKDYRLDDQAKIDKLENALKNVCDGLSLDRFMREYWFDGMFEEFNGLILVELKPTEELSDATTPEPYVRLVPVDEIVDIDAEAGYIEWVILKVDDKKIRVIDSEFDTIYIKDGSQYVMAPREDGMPDQIPNAFKKVPAIQVSTYRNNTLDEFLKDSPLTKVIPNLSFYQLLSDDHVLTRKIHANPLFYAYPVTCPTCNGSLKEKYYTEDTDGFAERECTTCSGQGMVPHWKRDVSQGISLPITENMERDGFPAAAPPAGYVQIDVESLNKQIECLDLEERRIEKGALGTEGLLTSERRGKQTATEMEINLQPLMDTLSSFSDNAQTVEQFIVNCIGSVLFGMDYECYIHYGRKYYLRSEQYVMDEFEKSKTGGAPGTYLRELLDELIHVRFESNPKALVRAMTLLDLEPYPERNITDDLVQLSQWCDTTTMKVKVNFTDFVERFEAEVMPLTAYLAGGDYRKKIREIRSKLNEYAKEIETAQPTGAAPQV